MGQSETGRRRIELQRVANATMIFKIDRPIINSRRIRLMTESTIELLAIREIRNRFALQMQRMIEFERVGVAQFFVLNAEAGMIVREPMNGLGVTFDRSRNLKSILHLDARRTKNLRRQVFALLGGCGHQSGIAVTESAMNIRRR